MSIQEILYRLQKFLDGGFPIDQGSQRVFYRWSYKSNLNPCGILFGNPWYSYGMDPHPMADTHKSCWEVKAISWFLETLTSPGLRWMWATGKVKSFLLRTKQTVLKKDLDQKRTWPPTKSLLGWLQAPWGSFVAVSLAWHQWPTRRP